MVMRVKYSPLFLAKVKKVDVRIYKSLREKIAIFLKDPNNSQLDNHELYREWEGFRSIDVTSDWRAVYQEIDEGNEIIAYFTTLGTHEELYETNKLSS